MFIAWNLFTILCVGVGIWQFRRRAHLEAALREAEWQLQLREKKIETILSNAPVVFSSIDVNGNFLCSEGKGLEKLGRKNNQSVGLNIYEMHTRNPVILEAVGKALAGEAAATTFVLNTVIYELYIAPDRDREGRLTGASMLSVDVTDRERALETSKVKSEFLATMSHEIRTPINGVMGMASLLIDTPLDKEQKEFVDAIHSSGSVLMTLINDILDLSKIEAGKLEIESIAFDLPETLSDCLKSLNFAASSKSIVLKSEVDKSLPAWVTGDPARLKQILNNLVGNAVKFTESGHVALRVTLNHDGAPPQVLFEVEDTGIGIPPEALNKLFISFSQGQASMARKYGGTGLGLAISKQLVEKMGGEIGVQSVPGKGSTFWFTLPMPRAQAPSLPDQKSPPFQPVALRGGQPPHVLLAEDNKVNQMIAVKMLQTMGCKTNVVTTGLAAVDAVDTFDYDLVLMDCQMPEMDGYEATSRIRARGADARNAGIPILAMTANAMAGDREKCLAAGMDDYISKPVHYEELAQVLRKWLEQSPRSA